MQIENPRIAPDSKNRMISFRLSKEEFDRFHAVCFNYGVRSVSELARAAINKLIDEPASVTRETIEARVSELEGRIRILARELKRLGNGSKTHDPECKPTHSLESWRSPEESSL